MSMPNIPDIDPHISLNRCETIEMLLSSIALEEISLSHILNAEGEKLQTFLKNNPECLKDYIKINNSINKVLRTVVKSQILLQFKLEDVMELDCACCCRKKKINKCTESDEERDSPNKRCCKQDGSS